MREEIPGGPVKRLKKAALFLFVAAVPLGFLLFPAGMALLTGCVTPQYTPPPKAQIPDYTTGLYSFPKFDLPPPRSPAAWA